MTILVTGAAGFVGMHVVLALLARGQEVIGVDDLNDHYAPALKHDRLRQLEQAKGFSFVRADIADQAAMRGLAERHGAGLRAIVHLAAQAGVRLSVEKPLAYVQSNLLGHMMVLELARQCGGSLEHLVYASSSSVYGGNTKVPFAVTDPVEQPVSLYAATKRADEVLSQSYAHLYDLPQTGLRFFTVYGPWGRPDMAYYSFTRAILAGQPIRLFNGGDMRRDFTFIDDIVAGVLAALDRPPARAGGLAPHRLFNLGNSRPVALLDFVATLENSLGQRAIVEPAPMQQGDVAVTMADIAATTEALGWVPRIDLKTGLDRFVAWYRAYHG